MNRLKLFGAALFLIISSLASADDKTIFFSIDLDGTIFDTIRDLRQVDTMKDLVKASDGMHQPVWGATAFLQSLIDTPNSKIVFFSGGDAERNKAILSQLIMKDGRSALDHAYKVLSKEDLTPVDPPTGVEDLKKFHLLKKDLTKIAPGIDLSHVIHVDDIPNYVLPGQEKNVLAIDPAYEHVGNYSRFLENQRQGMLLKRPPPSRAHWAYDTRRLIYAAGVVSESLEMMRRYKISPRDALDFLSAQRESDPRRFLQAGEKALSHYEVSHSPSVRQAKCAGIAEELQKQLGSKFSY